MLFFDGICFLLVCVIFDGICFVDGMYFLMVYVAFCWCMLCFVFIYTVLFVCAAFLFGYAVCFFLPKNLLLLPCNYDNIGDKPAQCIKTATA